MLCVGALVLAGSTNATALTRTQVVHDGAKYATAKGYKVGIAVVDTKTGAFYGAGAYNSYFASESLIKVFIAARLLVQGRMHGSTSARAYKMITQSDDAIASAFYGSVGGDGLINWVKAHYHVPDLGSPPTWPGWWGSTHLRPAGLAKLYVKLKKDPKVAPWLLNAMHHHTKYGSDGFYQAFGIPSATTKAAVKQGWGNDWDGGSNASQNTTGFVNNDRYVVVILGRGPASSYGSAIGSMLTSVAKRVLPGGVFPGTQPSVRTLSVRSGPMTGGNRVTVYGANFTDVRAVHFGTKAATAVKVLSSTKLQVTAPAYARDWVNVRVFTKHGVSTRVTGDRYLYEKRPGVGRIAPALGTTAGGTKVVLHGTAFTHVRKVLFGSVPANFVVDSRWQLTLTAPKHAAGPVDIRVVTYYGTSPVVATDRFTFGTAPVLTDIAPAIGPVGGGTKVTLGGTGFVAGSVVRVGDVSVTPATVAPDGTSLTVIMPGHAAGAVPVSVTSAFGSSAAITYTYG